jgi:hypothetical protein
MTSWRSIKSAVMPIISGRWMENPMVIRFVISAKRYILSDSNAGFQKVFTKQGFDLLYK